MNQPKRKNYSCILPILMMGVFIFVIAISGDKI
jgi:hypothetical protein